MSIKRYTAYKDNTITNAFKPNLETRGTGSNMGLADSLEVFSIFAQASSASLEATRFLVQFPVSSSDPGTTILSDRLAGNIPASGSVNFYLRLFNVVHDQTVPRDFTLCVNPLTTAWEEGYGLDMENYSDQTYNGTGSNWINSAANTPWVTPGGDYTTDKNYEQTFDLGTENLEIDITDLVEDWIVGADGGEINNNGIIIRLTGSQENGNRSYYTKKFSARGSEYFFSRPIIEARWDSSRKDQRGTFYVSSSVLSAEDNLNTVYFYNFVRGRLRNLPGVGTGAVYVRLYTSSSGGTQIIATPNNPVTGGWVSTGIYSASFALNTSEEIVYDRWSLGGTTYFTGSIAPITFKPSGEYKTVEYVANIINLENEYAVTERPKLRLYTREKNWCPTIYTVANANIENYIIDDIYYKVFRTIDNLDVIPYGTGSLNHTRLSYDVSGSYFDLDPSMLQPGFEYGIKFLFYVNNSYQEYDEMFKFKVIE